MNYLDPKLQARRTQIVEVLEMVCESLELSNSQFTQAKQRYEGVCACLAGSDDPVLRAITIYLQGSTALRTTVRPIGVNEHDVDLVAHVPDPEPELPVRRRARPRQDAQDVEGLEPEGLQAAVRGARQARAGHPDPQAC